MSDARSADDGLWPTARWEQALADPLTESIILDRTAEGERLKAICKSRGWPYRMVFEWIMENPGRAQRFEAALKACGLDLAQEGLEIIDDAQHSELAHHVASAKHRADFRLLMAKKYHKQMFGDAPSLTVNAHSGSLVSILAGLPAIGAPDDHEHTEAIDVTPVREQPERVIPIELRDKAEPKKPDEDVVI